MTTQPRFLRMNDWPQVRTCFKHLTHTVCKWMNTGFESHSKVIVITGSNLIHVFKIENCCNKEALKDKLEMFKCMSTEWYENIYGINSRWWPPPGLKGGKPLQNRTSNKETKHGILNNKTTTKDGLKWLNTIGCLSSSSCPARDLPSEFRHCGCLFLKTVTIDHVIIFVGSKHFENFERRSHFRMFFFCSKKKRNQTVDYRNIDTTSIRKEKEYWCCDFLTQFRHSNIPLFSTVVYSTLNVVFFFLRLQNIMMQRQRKYVKSCHSCHHRFYSD